MNLRSLDLNLLLVFDSLIQEGQVSRAAIKVGRTQSAVSHSLKKLRLIFKDELFIRTPSGMEPTPRALILAQSISATLADLQGAVDNFLNFDPAISSRNFSIGLSDGTAYMFLPNLIKKFRAQSPLATINVHNVTQSTGSEMLRTGKLDCVVLGNVKNVEPNLELENIVTEKFLCAIWNKVSISTTPLTLDNYLSYPHLQISVDGLAQGQVDTCLSSIGKQRDIRVTIPHYLLIPQILPGSDLIATCAASVLLPFTEKNEITLFTPPLSLPDITFSILTDKRSKTDLGNLWFRSLIKQQVQKINTKSPNFRKTDLVVPLLSD